jgi:hypothetical protein
MALGGHHAPKHKTSAMGTKRTAAEVSTTSASDPKRTAAAAKKEFAQRDGDSKRAKLTIRSVSSHISTTGDVGQRTFVA